MTTHRGLFTFLAGGSALLLAGCDLLRGAAEVRYRVTVEVVSGGELRSGSSVWSWRLSKPDVPLATPYDGEFYGEAVAVDLANGRTLFAILRGADGNRGMAELLPERWFGDIGRAARGEQMRFSPDRMADLRDIASRTGETVTLDCDAHPGWCPMLVTFRNNAEPESVEQVDPADLSAAFGPDHELKAIKVEIANDDVERGIGELLPWLSNHPEPRLDRTYKGSTDPDLAQRLAHGDFRRGA